MAKPVVIKSANPNKFPIRMVKYTEDEASQIFVQEQDDEGYWEEDGYEATSPEDAEQYFELRCRELSATPNQAAQDAYDDEHGTDNGYPIHNRREY